MTSASQSIGATSKQVGLLTRLKYFSLVGLLTSIFAIKGISSNPVTLQTIGETFGAVAPLKADKDSFYKIRIEPVFNAYCVECHQQSKVKGGLRVDHLKHTVLSGKSGHAIVPGSPENSLMITRMELPPENKFAMPPLGKARFTPDELTVLKLWIEKGASGSAMPEEFPNAPAPVKEIEFEKINFDDIKEARQPLAVEVAAFQNAYPSVLQYESRGSIYMNVNSYAIGRQFNDDVMQALKPFADHIIRLDAMGANMTDHSLPLILAMTRLEVARLANTNLSTEAVSQMIELKKLRELTLSPNLLPEPIQADFELANISLGFIGDWNE